MFTRLFFIIFIILFASDAFAQRLLLGASTTDIMFEKKDLSSPEQYNYNSDKRYRNDLIQNYNPYISFETRPFYLFNNVSLDFGVSFARNNKRTLKGYPEDYDNSSNTYSIDLAIDYNILYSGIYAVFGDKELGRNKNLSATIGFRFTKQELNYKYKFLGDTYQESEIQDSGEFVLRLDYANFNFSIFEQGGGGGGLRFYKLYEQNYRAHLNLRIIVFALSYSIYL